jgi:hypothetical protein
MAKYIATERSKAVTFIVLIFVNCGVYFESDHFINTCSLLLNLFALWEGCVFWMWPILIRTFHIFIQLANHHCSAAVKELEG